jgi:hypothetical protein
MAILWIFYILFDKDNEVYTWLWFHPITFRLNNKFHESRCLVLHGIDEGKLSPPNVSSKGPEA